jgi:predicted metal-dependent hydrolase
MTKIASPMFFKCSDGTELAVSLRLSTRARNRRITLSHQGALEVVFPAADSRMMAIESTEVQAFLETHRRWIERVARRTQPQREAYELSRAAGLPTHLEFPPVHELWQIEYRPTAAQKVTLTRAGLRATNGRQSSYALRLSGAVHDEAACARVLRRFVLQRARETLPAFGWRVCETTGAQPRDISVNSRKSAWGLCTRDGSIRLDRKLLFLPEDLATQIVLHEIAHLRQMNHSARFYEELFSLEGSSKEAERSVKQAMVYVPAWFRS